MVIEKLKAEDIPSLLELYKSLIPFEMSLEKSLEMYQDISTNENYFLAVAKEDGELLGSALGICCKCLAVSFLVIEDVIVKEGTRGKGIGRKLMESLDEFALKNNCAYAILVSSGHLKEAHKFYQNVGFIEHVEGFRKVY
ncbi:GNAT family N-acetyltransferase [Niallia endozanthoxylica]|uniref:GNAT family N-acetyltransferase n=1 Tax=Niallia endozanthoxylica TaxID=2036016 RepID=A0A5J5HN28_9BACI|nr:GNAT family N-acetyltransferase [Niallia endozanthoxylica]